MIDAGMTDRLVRAGARASPSKPRGADSYTSAHIPGNGFPMADKSVKASGQPLTPRSPAGVDHMYVNKSISSTVHERHINNGRSSSKQTTEPPNPALPPRPPADPEVLERKLEQARKDLAREKKLHEEARVDLSRKEDALDAVYKQAEDELRKQKQILSEAHEQTKAELERKEQEGADFFKRWKQASSELNRFLAQSQGFYQVTDQELIQKVTQLRYNIRNFADQRFSSESGDAKSLQSLWMSTKGYPGMSSDSFEACISSSSRRPIWIRAFLWAFLAKEIFGQFCWAGTRASGALTRLAQILSHAENDLSVSGSDAKRKFQTWRANTATLLIDAENLDNEADHGAHRKLNANKVQDICKILGPLSKSSNRELVDQVSNIINEALYMDKLISKQVAEVTWLFDGGNDSSRSFSDSIELQRDEKRTDDNQNMWLVLAPGMVKRGKSTGEDFHIENRLLEREIWSEPRTVSGPEGSHKSTTGCSIFNNVTKGLRNLTRSG